jgi:choline-sulfatase
MSLPRQLICIVVLAVSALAASAPPPNIILITVDTTRADRMGFLGSKLGLTPNLDTLARDSAVFTRAYSQAPLTPPSHATILTGTYPQFHQVNNFGAPLSEHVPYAPAILKAHGYRTAAFVAALALDQKASAPGFDRGFDLYDAGFGQSPSGADRYHSVERRGAEVVARALTWLNKHPKGPFFLWVHLYDAHDPYDPPEPYKTKYASALYDGEIAYADSCVGKLLTQLKARGLYNGAMIAVMADHGEALGDHGEETHGIFLYDETIHVPLVIKFPAPASAKKQPEGKRIDARVGLVDVMPTMMQVVGIPVPSEVQGESLLGLISPNDNSAVPQDRNAYAESDYGLTAYGWSWLRALRTGRYLYVDAPRPELYDQIADQKAEHDLSSASKAVTTTLAGQLDVFREKTSNKKAAAKASLDPETQEKLAALGYATGSTSGVVSKERGPDPKDKIETSNLIHKANLLRDNGDCAGAIPVLRELIVREPNMSILYAKLGHCLTLQHQYAEAVPLMRKLVEFTPDSPLAHFQLGKALLAQKDMAGAVPELELVVEKVPQWVRPRLVLANAYVTTQHYPDAIKQYNAILEAHPDHFEANLFLGRALFRNGDVAGAIPSLKKASELLPKDPGPHLALSNVYLKLGRFEEAAEEQVEAKRLVPEPEQ